MNGKEYFFQVADSDGVKATSNYTLTLTHDDQTWMYEQLSANQIIHIFTLGDLPLFQVS